MHYGCQLLDQINPKEFLAMKVHENSLTSHIKFVRPKDPLEGGLGPQKNIYVCFVCKSQFDWLSQHQNMNERFEIPALTSKGSRPNSKPSRRMEVKQKFQSSMDGSPSSGTSYLVQNQWDFSFKKSPGSCQQHHLSEVAASGQWWATWLCHQPCSRPQPRSK